MPVETVSPPAYVEETVTDVGFVFLGGETQSYVLYAADSIDEMRDHFELSRAARGGLAAETILVYKTHLLSKSVLQRTIRTPVKGKPTVQEPGTVTPVG